jgi:hypothetical protein
MPMTNNAPHRGLAKINNAHRRLVMLPDQANRGLSILTNHVGDTD